MNRKYPADRIYRQMNGGQQSKRAVDSLCDGAKTLALQAKPLGFTLSGG